MKFAQAFKIAALVGAVTLVGSAHAASVTCGNLVLGVRSVTVDPALTGGFCYGQNGNFSGDNFNTLAITTAFGGGTLDLLGKEIAANGDVASPLLGFTGSTSGTWSIANSVWTSSDRVFLAFHFGGGGDTRLDNPDSFIVELARADLTGTWALGGANAQLNGLSNIYVLGNGDGGGGGGGGGGGNVPEPGSLALAGLALLGIGTARKRLS